MIYTDYIESVQIGSNGTWNFDPPLRVGVEIPTRIWREKEPPYRLMSDLGEIEYSQPRPHLGEVGELMLITHDGFEFCQQAPNLCNDASRSRAWTQWFTENKSLVSASVKEGRKYYHLTYKGKTWTWELFRARWTDCANTVLLYIGRLI